MLKERAYEKDYDDYELIFEDDNIKSYKLLEGKVMYKDCELCKDPHSYILIIKNKAYGYNVRLPLCENDYQSLIGSLKRLYSYEEDSSMGGF